MRNTKKRFGNFITIISFSMIMLFFASDMSGNPNYLLLFGGIVGFWWGIKIIRKAKTQIKKAERYRLIRNTFSRKRSSENEEDQLDQE